MKLYAMQGSGNCYKLRLCMAQLGVGFELVDIDILQGESRTPEFLAMNPNGKVPLLEIGDGRFLPESNAALCYLADGTPLLPQERFEKAEVMQWLFWEQYSHEPNIATARFHWALKPGGREEMAHMFPIWREKGAQALRMMDAHLSDRDFMAANRYSIADIALYAYTHVAEEGGFDLSAFRAVGGWLERVAKQPGHVDINWRPA